MIFGHCDGGHVLSDGTCLGSALHLGLAVPLREMLTELAVINAEIVVVGEVAALVKFVDVRASAYGA